MKEIPHCASSVRNDNALCETKRGGKNGGGKYYQLAKFFCRRFFRLPPFASECRHSEQSLRSEESRTIRYSPLFSLSAIPCYPVARNLFHSTKNLTKKIYFRKPNRITNEHKKRMRPASFIYINSR